eukprot:CAMPEP_0182426038 /NCGR_PEP_ID=MMETSP1167-20130531/12517_1 /TAXON_ID=2988 /ORGANISM="Mallomonas Sp, Strain CCMP3275" /LENGTH=774 /DNA_ID=CAMNT_0024607193 /DNA_START=269 /DNA_END=2593 /DNA_ORIENTATION=-
MPFVMYASSKSGNKAAESVVSPAYQLEESAAFSMFSEFCALHAKSYTSEEEKSYRFNVFKENLQLIAERNEQEVKNGGTAVHGVNQFSDLTKVEFSKQYLGSMERQVEQNHDAEIGHVKTLKLERAAFIPTEIYDINEARKKRELSSSTAFGVQDWTSLYTTPMKEQGTCGSCYAFAGVSQLESDAIRLNLLDKNSPLSTQQIVSCNTNYPAGGGTCNGGNAQMALNWAGTVGGLMYDVDYPYTSEDGDTNACSFTPNSPDTIVSLSSVTDIYGEADMANYVMSTGPLGTRFVDAELIQSYTTGVFAGCPNPSTTTYGHAVQITGVNTNANPPYWIMRNSWGSRWGQDGYFYMKYGVGMCGIQYGFYTAPVFANSKTPTFTPTRNPNPDMNTAIPTAQPTPSAAPTARYEFSATDSVTYDGSTSKVTYNDGLGFSVSKTFSIAAWVTTTSTSGTQVLVSVGSTPGAWGGFDLVLTGGNPGILDSCSNGVVTYLPSVQVATGTRTHIALVKKGANYNIFVNGQSYKFTVAAGDCTTYNTDVVYLGWDAAINCWYDGTMDGVHMYNTILRQEYIQGLYETETPSTTASVPSPAPAPGPGAGAAYSVFSNSQYFDGSSTVPPTGMLTLPFTFTDKFSVTLWMSADPIINSTPDYLGLVVIENWVFLLKDKKVGILENCAGSLGIVGYPLNANQEYFLAVSKDGRDYKFCFNGGVLCGVLTMGMDCTYQNEAEVGEGDARLQSITANSHFVGTLSKVKIHDYALSQEEIQAIKDEGPN